MRTYIYDLIRRWFIYRDSYDFNEDFNCGYCGKPVLRRILYCSRICSDIDELKQLSHRKD